MPSSSIQASPFIATGLTLYSIPCLQKKLKSRALLAMVMELKGGWKTLCKETLAQLLEDARVWAFKEPVDAKALQLHDYTKIVPKPMNLNTVSRRLDNGSYKRLRRLSGQPFYKDVMLTFDNALLFNNKGDEIWKHAYDLKRSFQELWGKALERAGRADRGKGESGRGAKGRGAKGRGGSDHSGSDHSESGGQTSLLKKHVQMCKNPLSMPPVDMLDQVPA